MNGKLKESVLFSHQWRCHWNVFAEESNVHQNAVVGSWCVFIIKEGLREGRGRSSFRRCSQYFTHEVVDLKRGAGSVQTRGLGVGRSRWWERGAVCWILYDGVGYRSDHKTLSPVNTGPLPWPFFFCLCFKCVSLAFPVLMKGCPLGSKALEVGIAFCAFAQGATSHLPASKIRNKT